MGQESLLFYVKKKSPTSVKEIGAVENTTIFTVLNLLLTPEKLGAGQHTLAMTST